MTYTITFEWHVVIYTTEQLIPLFFPLFFSSFFNHLNRIPDTASRRRKCIAYVSIYFLTQRNLKKNVSGRSGMVGSLVEIVSSFHPPRIDRPSLRDVRVLFGNS